MDGGLVDNTPTDHFNDNEVTSANTLVFVFGEGRDGSSPYHKALHEPRAAGVPLVQPGLIERFAIDTLVHTVGGVAKTASRVTEHENRKLDALVENFANSVVEIKTGSLLATSFDDAGKQMRLLNREAYFATLDKVYEHTPAGPPDIYLLKKFIYQHYRQYQSKGASPRFKHSEATSRKANAMLDYCSDKVSERDNIRTVTRNYLTLCCYDRSSQKLSPSTSSAEALIEVLNQASTPELVKQPFIGLWTYSQAVN